VRRSFEKSFLSHTLSFALSPVVEVSYDNAQVKESVHMQKYVDASHSGEGRHTNWDSDSAGAPNPSPSNWVAEENKVQKY
jgi:hypothetical protein